MPEYVMLLHRFEEPWPPPGVRRVLELAEREITGFFPVKSPVAVRRTLMIPTPADFHMSNVPKAFKGDSFVRVPFRGAHEEDLVVLDSEAGSGTSVITLKWPPDAALPPVKALRRLLIALGDELQASQGALTDDRTFMRSDLYERRQAINTHRVPLALYWMNWLGSTQLEAIGPDRLQRLAAVAEVERIQHGALVVLQEEPFADENPAHVRRREEAEAALGLAELHRLHPKDPRG